ncbi:MULTISPECIES: SDR family NAD(P)-dependent oxidoreductase [Pseudomonas]|uniref:SDR family NAD(P)-dependent oxidoreductase n=1 Tax=Pseudomonas poae TaxID=200451 RepID=A0A7M1KLL0_9PSED|nr:MULTISPECIES: SDR family NAD(P)-dependent oxidoreductase [Pseudomonas]QHD07213.1 short-chain dehydrogenase [Pseudomonas sp. R76]QOQ77177.1 SDR family NAD(P)-dependent oxidoreductase [Pseudomonas poae]
MNLLGKTIVISGCARGLGHAAAHKLKGQGATVIGLDILEPQELGLLDGFYQVDLCDRRALAQVITAISTDFGDIDILVNNAGTLTLERGETGVTDEVTRAVDVNLFAPWQLVAGFLPGLLRKRGKVVNVSSLFALVNAPYVAAYAASKRALSAYSDVLRMQYRGQLDVVTVYPGFIDTAIHLPAQRVGLSVKRLVTFMWGDKTLLSLEEKLDAAADGLVRACRKDGLRNRGLTFMGTLAMYTARIAPSVVDAFIALRLRTLTRGGHLALKPELIE